MYLAGILGLCALLHVPAWGFVCSGYSSFAPTSEAGISRQNQEPAKPDQPAPQQDQPKPDSSQTVPPSENAQQPEASPNSATPNAASNSESGQPNQKPPAAPRKRKVKKKHTPPATGPEAQKKEAQKKEAQKKVVNRGGTAEPTTQLAPSMTDEQAALQRQNTNQLLASTDASLQQLSGRQLTKDEEETVTQIRKFMEQVKEADKNGDLPRAYKLAVKAHLLSDALVKP